MARCELTGKGPVVKNLVSHSNIKTKSRASANIQPKKLFSQALKEFVSLRISTGAIRSMEHMGGFDTYILSLPVEKLSKRATTVRTKIRRKLAGKGSKGVKNETKN